MHNQIPAPDRNWDGNATDDNSTYWVSDFNRAHYQDMMFGERRVVQGLLPQAVQRPLPGQGRRLRLGHGALQRGPLRLQRRRTDADGYWNFVKDTATAWYDAQKAAGKTDAEIKTYLAQFDKVDRYDYDGDGNFNEPDGYIDHFQAIHAGEGEEAGGGAQGADAIWSHRWYAYSNNAGKTGPTGNLLGGVPLGNSGIWIGDYTTEPENGGLGVFAHEFGHDLGLPDLYDTAGGDNGTGFWTLMSGGSWLNHGTDSIGTTPGYMGAVGEAAARLARLQGGAPTAPDADGQARPGRPRQRQSVPQALSSPCPDKTVTTDYNTPHSGTVRVVGRVRPTTSTPR